MQRNLKKNQKSIEVKEAELKLEKNQFEKLKKDSADLKQNDEVNGNTEQHENHEKSSQPERIFTSYLLADITTYPSMATHWLCSDPDENCSTSSLTKEFMLEALELNRKAMDDMWKEVLEAISSIKLNI